MVSIAAFQAVDPGSIPGRRKVFFCFVVKKVFLAFFARYLLDELSAFSKKGPSCLSTFLLQRTAPLIFPMTNNCEGGDFSDIEQLKIKSEGYIPITDSTRFAIEF